MLIAVLGGLSGTLTLAMFMSKQYMLGFPCTIFWAIFSGYCYQASTTTWDIYYLTFFGSIGMAIFCAYAAFALRTKKEEVEEGDQFIDEGKEDIKFIDEGRKPEQSKQKTRLENRANAIRERSRKRLDAIRQRRARAQ